MSRDDQYLADILDPARLAVSYVSEITLAEFLRDVQRQDSVVRRLEIIGEAARRISEKTRSAYPDVPWKRMRGMRNVMIHDYDNIDLSIVWDTVQTHLPELIRSLEEIVLLRK